jgi:large subunit ribosomal protein L4e
MQNTAVYRGSRWLPTHERSINVERARLPRLKNRRGLLYGRVARVPQAVGGRKTHAPKPEAVIAERANKKEKRAALLSAIAATANKSLVMKRHVVEKDVELPIAVVNDYSMLSKTRDVVKTLKAIGVFTDVENAKAKRKKRAGKGKKRGRKYKRKKSLLIVTKENSMVYKAARNLEGVEVCEVRNLNAELFAPGTVPGRLTVWTEEAIKSLGESS